jgi:hypothetical protein
VKMTTLHSRNVNKINYDSVGGHSAIARLPIIGTVKPYSLIKKVQPAVAVVLLMMVLAYSRISISIAALLLNYEDESTPPLLRLRRERNQQEQLTTSKLHTTEIHEDSSRINKPASSSQYSRSFTVDVLSVSSTQQLDLLQAQRELLASHITVRNFFNATEHDDADPHCHKYLTWEEVQQVSSFCRNRPPSGTSRVFRHMRGKCARVPWLQQKENPAGWMCAQVRPYSGLMKAYHHYQDNSEEGLPDYFILLDDDTYYDMEEFERNFGGTNSSEALFYAGCLIRAPAHLIHYTFPVGGFGSILSKGALRNLFEPIHCPTITTSLLSSAIANDEKKMTSPIGHHHQPLCDRIAENQVGEKQSFKTGMNLLEFMYQYVNAHRYRDVSKWKEDDRGGGGFCMHSDWIIGFFANYYNISRHVLEPIYFSVPHARIEAYKNSEINGKDGKGTGVCHFKGDKKCDEGSEICHRVTPQWMNQQTDRLRLKFPTKFDSLE